jgi:hypothetical protein
LESGSRRQGHTAAQPGGGRREPYSGEAAARWEEGASQRAFVGARGGGGHDGSERRPRKTGLAAAALPGAGGRHDRWLGGPARRGREQRPLYRRRASFLVTGGRTGGGASGGSRPGDTSRTAGRCAAVRRREARGVLGMRAVMGKEQPGRARPRAARARAPRQRRGRGAARRDSNVSDWQRLTEIFSKKLNRSAQSGK